MRRLCTIAFATIVALLLQACETDIDLKQIKSSGSRIYINAMAGEHDTTWVKILKTIPIGESKGNSKDIDITSLSFRVDGKERPLVQGSDSIWFNAGDCKPGSDIAIEVEARGLGKASAESSIPDLPEVKMERDIVTFEESDYIRYTLEIEDNPDEEDFYGLSVMTAITTIVDGVELGGFSNPIWFINSPGSSDLEDLTGSGDPMNYTHYDWISGHSDGWQNINFFSDKDLKDGKIEFFTWYYPDVIDDEYEWYESYDREKDEWIVSTHIRSEFHTYTARIFKLSPECYRHMRADFMKSFGTVTDMGLTAPNFTYCNIRNGYGVFCGLSMIQYGLGNL